MMNKVLRQHALDHRFPALEHRPEQDNLDSGIADLLDRIRRSRVPLLAWVVICIAAAMAYLATTPPEYTAYTQIVLEPHRSYSSLSHQSDDAGQSSLDAAQADSEIQVVKSERLLRKVFDTLDLANSPDFTRSPAGILNRLKGAFRTPSTGAPDRDQLGLFLNFMSRVAVRRLGQSYVLEVSYRASSPESAARVANSLTAAYVWDQVGIQAARVQRGSEYLQGRVSDLKREEEAALAAMRDGVIPPDRFPDADARVISAALMPTGKSFPSTGLVLIFATAMGLLTGLAVIIARHGFDQTVRSRHQIARSLGLPTLAVLPRLPASLMRVPSTIGALPGDDDAFTEGLRTVAAMIMDTPAETRRRVIGIVSWHSGEGKTTLAANLALLLAGAGHPVTLIDGDLRDPSLTRALAPDSRSGLSDLLRRNAPPPSIAVDRNLTFIPATGEARATEPTLFLGSSAMQHLVENCRNEMDVIIDLPAASRSADVRSIASTLDGIILVAEVKRTTIQDLSSVISILSPLTVIMGIVLNKAESHRVPRRHVWSVFHRSRVRRR